MKGQVEPGERTTSVVFISDCCDGAFTENALIFTGLLVSFPSRVETMEERAQM